MVKNPMSQTLEGTEAYSTNLESILRRFRPVTSTIQLPFMQLLCWYDERPERPNGGHVQPGS